MTRYQTLKDLVSEFFQLTLAILFATIGLKSFLLPNGFLDGGVTGISILLNKVFEFDISMALPLISIPFFVIGYKTLSLRILLKSVVAILVLSVLLSFDNFQTITNDKLIIATFGGLFLGCGIGLAIRSGAVLDGSEILGIFVNNQLGLSIGTTILIFNIVLFGITALVLTPEIAMYSILTFIVTGKAIDFTIQGFENYVGLMVVSMKSEALQEYILETGGQGITVYKGKKGFGKRGVKEDHDIIHIIVNRIEVKRINRLINEIDDDAFIVEYEVNNVKGGKLRKFMSKV